MSISCSIPLFPLALLETSPKIAYLPTSTTITTTMTKTPESNYYLDFRA